ncbi:MAG TPA: hypothetical protein PKB15_07155 [Acidimicrobiia bacterium]|nr:hypothetical protein [Acidimicrobiia bacterium]
MSNSTKKITTGNANGHVGMSADGLPLVPVHFSPEAQKEVALLFDQLTAYFTHKAQKYVDPVSKAIFSASPAVVVEFDGTAIPVCAVRHSPKTSETSDIVFYEYSPQGRHIGTLFVDDDSQIVVVNSHDPRTIDFSDIKPHEIRDFVGALALAIEGQKWSSRLRASLLTLRSLFRRDRFDGGDDVLHHNVKLPVEVSPHTTRIHRLRAGLKKFIFRHPIISAEIAALGLSLVFQSVIGFVGHQLKSEELILQLDQSAQVDVDQDAIPVDAALTPQSTQLFSNIPSSDHVEASEYLVGDNAYAHAFLLDRSSVGRVLALSAPHPGKCVSLMSDVVTPQSQVYVAAPNGMAEMYIHIDASGESEMGVNGLVTLCNRAASEIEGEQVNGGHLAVQVSSVDVLNAAGVETPGDTRTLAISK